MVEFDFSEAAQREYFLETPEGIRFLDPVLGVPLSSHEPPPSLLDDMFTGPGIRQLHKMAKKNRLTIQLILAFHGCAQDFADIVDEYGPLLQAAPMVAIETDWLDPNPGATLPGPTDVEHFFDTSPGRRAFQEAELSLLLDNGSIPLLAEHSTDPRSELSVSLNYLIKLYGETYGNGDVKATEINQTAYQFTRHWTIPAQVGYWLYQLEESGQLPEGQLTVPLILGSWHAPTATKLLDYFGIPTQAYHVSQHIDRLTPHERRYGDAFMASMSTGVMTHDQAATSYAPR